MKSILYYIHDPMCSWCWGFNNTWIKIQAKLPESINVQYVLGGLAPDSDQPMHEDLQNKIRSGWYRIQEHIPGTEFNYEFWTQCKPRRSTYPASRAVIAAKTLDISSEKNMLLAIQEAYYLQAKNPSDDEVLVQCAEQIGLDTGKFQKLFRSPSVQQKLLDEIEFSRSIGVNSFPSLVLKQEGAYSILEYDYNDPRVLLSQLNEWPAREDSNL